MIVTNSPGTTPDTVGRIIVTEMSRLLGQQIAAGKALELEHRLVLE